MNGAHITSSSSAEGRPLLPFRGSASTLPGDLENRILRQALQKNLVTFPSQVPVFARQSRPDLQQKIVVLYFVRAWSMEGIARRFRLGRQRIGQILTAWRIRAVREGYIQAIEPEHALFKKMRVEPAQLTEMPAQSSSDVTQGLTVVPARVPIEAELHEPKRAAESVTELRGSNLAEELRAIVNVLDNQLRLCSKPLNGNIESCDQLLGRAKTLCARLEAQAISTGPDSEWRTTAVLSSAKELFQRFHEHALKRSGLSSANSRDVPPRSSPRVVASM